jgi:hypothetical protein
MEAAGFGLAGLGYPAEHGVGERQPCRASRLLATDMGEGAGEMSGFKRAFMGLRAAIGNFNGFLAAPAVASGYHRDKGPGAMVKTHPFYGCIQ